MTKFKVGDLVYCIDTSYSYDDWCIGIIISFDIDGYNIDVVTGTDLDFYYEHEMQHCPPLDCIILGLEL
jgi:hypothetical protein